MFKNWKTWKGASLILVGLLLGTGCEDSYLMKKFRGEDAKPTQESAPSPTPTPTQPEQPAETSPTPPTPSAETPAPAPTPEDLEKLERAKMQKINRYVACLNRTQGRVQESKQRYLSWVNEQTGPTCQERYIKSRSLYSLYEDGIAKCQQAAQNFPGQASPTPQLDSLAQELATAYAQLVPLVEQTRTYYEEQAYLEDKCAQGQALHPKLMETFTRYENAAKGLTAQITPIKEAHAAKRMAELEKAGKNLEWQMYDYLEKAKALVATVPHEGGKSLNSEAYLQAFTPFQAAYQALSAEALAKPFEKEGIYWFDPWMRKNKRFYAQANTLKRQLSPGQKLDPKTLRRFFRTYNQMIHSARLLNFREKIFK